MISTASPLHINHPHQQGHVRTHSNQYDNSNRLVIPRNNGTSDLFNVDQFMNNDTALHSLGTTSPNAKLNRSRSNVVRRNNTFSSRQFNKYKYNANDSQVSPVAVAVDHTMSNQLPFPMVDNSMNNQNMIRRSNTRSYRQPTVRRSNTASANQTQQTIRRSNTTSQRSTNNNQLQQHSFHQHPSQHGGMSQHQYQVRRNHTVHTNKPSRYYSKINTWSNFEAIKQTHSSSNHDDLFGVKINNPVLANQRNAKSLSLLQRQRNMMKNEFVFPNGEIFKPRNLPEKKKEVITPSTPTPVPAPVANTTPTPVKKEKKKKKKGFGSFLKRLVSNDSDSDDERQLPPPPPPPPAKPLPVTPTIQITPTMPGKEDGKNSNESLKPVLSREEDLDEFDSSKLIERLETQWGKVYFPSVMVNDQQPRNTNHTGKVQFDDVIFVNDTYSQDDYDRTDYYLEDEEDDEEDEENPNNDKKLVYDEEFGFIDHIKHELNQFKRNEMLVHIESTKYIQFSR